MSFRVNILDTKTETVYMSYQCTSIEYALKKFAQEHELTIDQYGGIPTEHCYFIATTYNNLR